jgi:hypothetical protein
MQTRHINLLLLTFGVTVNALPHLLLHPKQHLSANISDPDDDEDRNIIDEEPLPTGGQVLLAAATTKPGPEEPTTSGHVRLAGRGPVPEANTRTATPWHKPTRQSELGELPYNHWNHSLSTREKTDELLGRINSALFSRAEGESELMRSHLTTLLSCSDLKWSKKIKVGPFGKKVGVDFSGKCRKLEEAARSAADYARDRAIDAKNVAEDALSHAQSGWNTARGGITETFDKIGNDVTARSSTCQRSSRKR